MFSRPNATSLSTRVITTWFSGSWNTVETIPASSAGPESPRVEAADLDPTRKAPAVEVRHEAGEGAEQRRLAASGWPRACDHLSRVELERDVTDSGHAAGVGEGEPCDPRTRAIHATATRTTAAGQRNMVDPGPAQVVVHGLLSLRPKPRASVASARPVARSSEPATRGDSSMA